MTTLHEALDSACLLAVTGSTAYGLAHENSDIDKMGVFIAPASAIAGLDWSTHDNSWTNTSPEGDDITMHEIGKFLRLALGGNPTLIELLFMDDYEILTPEGKTMVELRGHIVSEDILRKSYYGYAVSQLKRVQEAIDAGQPFKPKMARHTLRIARQGVSLLRTGEFDVKVGDPQEYFDLTEMDPKGMLKKIGNEVLKIDTCASDLPATPNRRAVADFLRTIRYEYP